MTINQIASAQNAYRNLYISRTGTQNSMRSLSSGYRINSASDDAAGLAISEKMRGQIGGLDKAYENAQAGVSLVQTAEGGLDGSHAALQRMRELAVQASNGTYSAEDRALLNQEFNSLKSELNRISGATNYNGMNLLDGTLGGVTGEAGVQALGIDSISSDVGGAAGNAKFTIEQDNGVYSITAEFGGETITQQINAGDTSATFSFNGNDITVGFSGGDASLQEGVIGGVGIDASGAAGYDNAISAAAGTEIYFQIGANGTADQKLGLSVDSMSAYSLGLTDTNLLSASGANAAISAIDNAINQVSSQRGTLGATQNRLEHSMNNLQTQRINTIASESRIRDLDMAKEYMNYTQRKIQMQASQAMMAQSMNLARQNMMSLLGFR